MTVSCVSPCSLYVPRGELVCKATMLPLCVRHTLYLMTAASCRTVDHRNSAFTSQWSRDGSKAGRAKLVRGTWGTLPFSSIFFPFPFSFPFISVFLPLCPLSFLSFFPVFPQIQLVCRADHVSGA